MGSAKDVGQSRIKPFTCFTVICDIKEGKTRGGKGGGEVLRRSKGSSSVLRLIRIASPAQLEQS